jgi:D-tyrosyl-tRNA(Tyr) deacylase
VRAVVQRVARASVTVAGEPERAIGAGLVILVGVARDDGPAEAEWIAQKCAHLRIFADDEGKMNRSLLETGGQALVVSQFTLYGDARKGRRPSFIDAAPPEIADPLYRRVADLLRDQGVGRVETGTFQTHMVVSLDNDGPVTVILDTPGPEGP